MRTSSVKPWLAFSLVFGGALAGIAFLYFRASLPPLSLSPEQESAILHGFYLAFGGFGAGWLIGSTALGLAMEPDARDTGTGSSAAPGSASETGPYEWHEPVLFGNVPADARLARAQSAGFRQAA